ncbi:MAG: ComF family protein [Eggerthella lenta]
METTLDRRGIRARTAGAGHESAVCGAWKAPCYPRRMTIARTTLALAPARPTAREAGACPRVPRRERLLRTAGLYGRGAAEAIAETLWPTRCAVCDTPGEVLCAPCSLNLSHIDWWRACPRCGAPFGRVQCSECNDVLMSVAGRDEPPFDACTSAVAFDDAAARIVRTWKDAGERRLAGAMATLMAPMAPPSWLADHPCIVPVPATAAARRRRGFDHGEELAQALADRLGLAVAPVLARPRSRDQRALARRDRLANMEGRFIPLPGASAFPSVILVDDVYTTGATLFAATDAVRVAGAATVRCLTFARVW